MPLGKNPDIRYKILDRCFSNFKHKYDIDELLEIVNDYLNDFSGQTINVRQLREDIRFMRDPAAYNAPIKAYPLEGNKCYYRYEDESFSIFKSELSLEDTQNLSATIEMLKKYRGIPANAWLEEIISNLELRFGLKSDSEELISFGQNEQLKGLEFLSDIIDYTLNHQTIVVFYRTFKGKELEMTIHPYYVKQYNGRWFLFGLNEKFNKISVIALDRIRQIYLPDIVFKPNNKIDFSSYFDDIIGVTMPDGDTSKETFIFKFSKERFPYVESKPMHKTQETIDEKNCIIKINVFRNRELDQQIFSYIPDITIIEPEWYKQLIIEKIQENLKKYFPVQ